MTQSGPPPTFFLTGSLTDMPQQWLKLRFCLLLMMTCLIVEMLSHLKIEILEYTDTDLYYILHRLADHNLLDLMFLNLCCVDNALDKVIKNKTPL